MDREQSLARLILNLSNTIIHNRNRHLEALGLTASQADCMKFFLEHDRSTVKALKEALGIAHQTAQGIVSRLVEKGFLTARQSEDDRRCQIIRVTEAGLGLSQKLHANGSRTAAMLVKGMSEEEQQVFFRLLCIAYENVKDDGRTGDQSDKKRG